MEEPGPSNPDKSEGKSEKVSLFKPRKKFGQFKKVSDNNSDNEKDIAEKTDASDKPKVSFFRPRKRMGQNRNVRKAIKNESDSNSDSEKSDNSGDESDKNEVVKVKRPRFRGGIGAATIKNYKANVYASSSESEDEKSKVK